jgi:transposase
MSREPYRSAKRVFWIVDNGSSHRGKRSVRRLKSRWPNSLLVHLPVHASWLNQIEIYFSVLQRKVLTPNDSRNLEDLQKRVLNFQRRYQRIAKPFKWRFSRQDLAELMLRLNESERLPKTA